METLLQDLKYSFRMLLKSYGFTVLAVLILAVGISANSVIFSVIKTVLLSPLPYKDQDRLVIISDDFLQLGFRQIGVSVPEFVDYRDQSQVFERVAIYDPISVNLTGVDQPERILALGATYSYFLVLGVDPILGRTFRPEDDQPGITEVAVISYGLWQRRFGGDTNVIGKQLRLDNDSYTVVGVMPSGFRHPERPGAFEVEIWFPAGFSASPYGPPRRDERRFQMIARLKQGVALSQAQAEMDAIASNLQKQYPEHYQEDSGWKVTVSPLLDQIVGNVRSSLLILMGAVVFVLLISCSNVANLLLARPTGRRKEVGIRVALGATRLRLIRQFLTESVMLAILGGALGLLFTLWGLSLIRNLSPDNFPRVNEIGIDGVVFGFTTAVSILTGIFFGLVPAFQASKTGLNESLKEGGTRTSAGVRVNLIHRLLVICEFATAMVLLIGAGLLVRSFLQMQSVDPGFDPRNILTVGISLPFPNQPETGKHFDMKQRELFYQKLTQRVEAVPGVESVGLVSRLPLSGTKLERLFVVEGRENKGSEGAIRAESQRVSANYFRTMGITLLKGRDFTEQDNLSSPPVIIINEALARHYWPDQEPIGQRIKLAAQPNAPWLSIIAVVKNVKTHGLDVDTPDELFMPLLQNVQYTMNLVIRTASDPLSISKTVEREVREVDVDQPVYNIKTLEVILAAGSGQRRFSMFLLSVFAAIALVLAAMGIYAVMSYMVSQRAREIGIRMALGAQPRDILGLVMGQALVVALIGIGIGFIIALIMNRVMAGLLFGVSATDLLTYATTSLMLVGVAMLASYVPSRRAIRVDPITVLRYE
jgi:predicted permease